MIYYVKIYCLCLNVDLYGNLIKRKVKKIYIFFCLEIFYNKKKYLRGLNEKNK